MILYFVATESMYEFMQDRHVLPQPIPFTEDQLNANPFLIFNPHNRAQLLQCNERHAIDYARTCVYYDSGPVYVFKLNCNDNTSYNFERIDEISYHFGIWIHKESLDEFNAGITRMEVVHTFVHPFTYDYVQNYSIEGKIIRKGNIIGYFLREKKKCYQYWVTKPYHVNTVLRLAAEGQIYGYDSKDGQLIRTDPQLGDIPFDEYGIGRFERAVYKTTKHPDKHEFNGRIYSLGSDSLPTLHLVGTYRDKAEKILGYRVFCPQSLDEYSLDFEETHHAVEMYEITGDMGEEIERDRKGWDWNLYFVGDPDLERIDLLPREYLGECQPPTGGHLERDNLFQRWESLQRILKRFEESPIIQELVASFKESLELENDDDDKEDDNDNLED